MELVRDAQIDPAPLAGRRIAILGYGNQGRAQALNLSDSGIDVVVGLREGSPSIARAASDAIAHAPLEQAVAGADVVMLLAPDETLADLYRRVEPSTGQGASLGFSHGLAIRFGMIQPRADLSVFMVAPKGPGSALRSSFQQGKGMRALWAVDQDPHGEARGIALAYGAGIGCGRAGLLESSFAEECEADLFNEQAVVWGGVPALLIAGFDTLVEAGVRPEIAYMECIGELTLLAELIEARGIAGMREAISNTAELGAVIGGPGIVDDGVRERMRAALQMVRDGRFAALLENEAAEGYPRLRAARSSARELAVERARKTLDDA